MFTDLPNTPHRTAHRPPRVAIVGSGISGLAAAHTLQGLADITLFESGDYFGGHTHTVDMTLPNAQRVATTFGVDTGFLVLNERTYPNLLALFAQLGVPIAKSDMSFSVQAPGAAPGGGPLEWSGCNLSTVFAQRRNLFNPRFLRMLADIVRFNRITTKLAEQGEDLRDNSPLLQPLGEFLKAQGFSDEFRDWYFLPMMGCIWSCPTDQMLAFPVATMVRFCHNHGLIQVTNRPQWYTVDGGARQYVQKITDSIADKRLNSPVQQVLRDSQGVRVVTEGRWSGSTPSCWPATATRPCACSVVRHRLTSARCWVPSATSPTARCCTPTLRCCPRANSPGPPGTTNARRAGAWSPPRFACTTCSTVCSRCRWRSRWWCRSTRSGRSPRNMWWASTPTTTRCSIWRPSERRPACPPCRASSTRTLPARGPATGSTKDGLKSGLHAARSLIDAHQLVPMTQRVDAQRAALPGVFA